MSRKPRVSSKYRLFDLRGPTDTGLEVNTGVEITRGRFKGIKYHYTKVDPPKDSGDGNTHVSFGYNLLEDPHGRFDPENQKLVNLMGRILMDIIRSGVESQGPAEGGESVDDDDDGDGE